MLKVFEKYVCSFALHSCFFSKWLLAMFVMITRLMKTFSRDSWCNGKVSISFRVEKKSVYKVCSNCSRS